VQLKIEQLGAHLNKGLAALYTISSDEPLLALETADKLRAAARAAGYAEREVLHVDARTDWSTVLAASQSMSLFGDRKLLEIRLPTGKPGKDGSQALQDYAARVSPDTLTLIALPRLDRQAKESAWFTALDRAGVVFDIPVVERAQLPAWIGARLAAQEQSADRACLEWIADRVEGNLLAAHQEIQKLALLHPPGALSLEAVQDAVMSVARYDVFKLNEAMLAGDLARLARMLEGLRAEGEAAPLVLWAIAEEIRTLARLASGLEKRTPLPNLMQQLRIWGPRQRLVEPALKRLAAHPGALDAALQRAAELDKMVKGLRIAFTSGDEWNELLLLARRIAQPGLAQP
jgi:DNA polymerase-3 subunit delta